jgi:ribonuclease HI
MRGLHLRNKAHASALLFGEKICPAKTENIKQKTKSSQSQHPAGQKMPNITILSKLDAAEKVVNTKNNISFYTDASKQGDSPVGSAVVGWSQDSWITIGTETLHPFESVFRGELKAIAMALDSIEANVRITNGTFVIFSDCMSGLQAIKNIHSQEDYVVEIHNALRRLKKINVDIEIAWVPSHCGIEGNEAADAIAKLQTEFFEVSDEVKDTWTKSRMLRTLRT